MMAPAFRSRDATTSPPWMRETSDGVTGKRVASLGGELELTSEPFGSRLDISLPLKRLAWPRPIARSAAA